MRSDIRPGAAFPDYELSDQTGTKRKLSDLQGIDSMIVVLSRGHYCPKDRRQLRHLVDFYPELKVGYARLVTISTDNLLQTNEFRDGLGAQWPFLSDPGLGVLKWELDLWGRIRRSIEAAQAQLLSRGESVPAPPRN